MVSSKAGLVTLSGTATSLLNKADGWGDCKDRTDEEIAEEIRGLIVHSVYLDDALLQVDVTDHVAKLSGAVPSAAAKDRAEQVAEIWGISSVDVSGVEVAPDRLDVSQRRQRYANVTDEEIEKALERSFRADPIMFSRVNSIESSVNGGVVVPTGLSG